MAKKKRRGVTLFELLQKDRNPAAGDTVKQAPGAVQGQGPARLQVPAAPASTSHTPSLTQPIAKPDVTSGGDLDRLSSIQADEEGYVFHLSRHQTVVLAVGGVVLLLVVMLIGGRMFRSDSSLPPQQEAQGQLVDGERLEPLETLIPSAGSDTATPDSPVRLAGKDESEPAAGNRATPAEGSRTTEQARSMAAARVAAAAPTAALAERDTRTPGLNYLVIQIIPPDVKPSPREHADEIRKFLASKDIRTLVVSTKSGGLMVVSEEGAEDRRKLDSLAEKVRQAGKEYASARYMGRYNFASPYPALYSGN